MVSVFIGKAFKAAAWIAARLPRVAARKLTFDSNWYAHNDYFKFAPGQKITIKNPNLTGFGKNPCDWVVVEHTKGAFGDDAYLIKTAEGKIENHYKWNIENLFAAAKPHRPAKTPINPSVKNNNL